jgi:hypothetical protein
MSPEHMMGNHNMPEQYDMMDYNMMPHMDDQKVMGDYDMGNESHMMNMPYDMAPQHMNPPHQVMGDYDMGNESHTMNMPYDMAPQHMNPPHQVMGDYDTAQMPHHQQLPYNMPHQGHQMMPEHQYPQHYPQAPSCSCGKKKR